MPKVDDVILENFKIETLAKDHEIASLVARTPMIVVYNNTTDYGKLYIARLWKYKNLNKNRFNSILPRSSHVPTKYIVTGNSMNEIRSKMPWFLNFLPRYQEDYPCIVGVYI